MRAGRTRLGDGGSGAATSVSPGSVADQLGAAPGTSPPRRAGPARGEGRGHRHARLHAQEMLKDLARSNGALDDPTVARTWSTPHPRRARRVQQPAAQGGQAGRRGHPRHAQHLQAGDERHDAPDPRPRPAHRRSGRDAPRLRGRRQGRDRGRHRQPVPQPGHLGIAGRRSRRSTAGPTRSSATSSASGCSGCPRPNNDKTLPFSELPKAPDDAVAVLQRPGPPATPSRCPGRSLPPIAWTDVTDPPSPVGTEPAGGPPPTARRRWRPAPAVAAQADHRRTGHPGGAGHRVLQDLPPNSPTTARRGSRSGDVGQLALALFTACDRRQHPHLPSSHKAALPGLACNRPSSCARRRS